MSFYSGFHFCLGAVIRCIFRVKVEGENNLPDEGAFIVASNHISNADPVILAVSVKNRRKIRFMAKKELFEKKFLARLLGGLGAFAVDRKRADVASIRHAVATLEKGEHVGIFPEGTRNNDTLRHYNPRG